MDGAAAYDRLDTHHVLAGDRGDDPIGVGQFWTVRPIGDRTLLHGIDAQRDVCRGFGLRHRLIDYSLELFETRDRDAGRLEGLEGPSRGSRPGHPPDRTLIG